MEADLHDDRQRMERWLEESQYLLGRILPGYLDERDRLKHKLVTAERETERLRHELDELRKTVAGLQSDVQFYRSEHKAAADAFAAMLGQLDELHKPLAVIHRRLQGTHPTVPSNA